MSRKLGIVLAAGKGTRMKSDLPKVAVQVCGRPMIDYVIDALESAGIDQTVVIVGYGQEVVRAALQDRQNLEFAVQHEQRGTGHAVMSAEAALAEHDGPVLVVAGDSPMMQVSSIRALLDEFERTTPACLLGTAQKQDPSGLGRIDRDAAGNFLRIVEEKDADARQKQITEVNMSCYVFNGSDLRYALKKIDDQNAQGEFYLTDCPGVLLDAGRDVRALDVLQPIEALSINTLDELSVVEQAMVLAHSS